MTVEAARFPESQQIHTDDEDQRQQADDAVPGDHADVAGAAGWRGSGNLRGADGFDLDGGQGWALSWRAVDNPVVYVPVDIRQTETATDQIPVSSQFSSRGRHRLIIRDVPES